MKSGASFSPAARCAWLAAALAFAGSVRADSNSQHATAVPDELRVLRSMGSVLHVGAHPDDENTELITWLSRGRGYRAAYLSLTRGDGGQNESGPDFGEYLGVLRTQELLAARRLDGGRQFFTRAIDFGYSKTPEETLKFWDRDQVLADVVRIYRKFRPDVVVTRFPVPPGSGGHGHHTASAILAVEAFNLSGDPDAYPEQIAEGLQPWQPRRILWNSWSSRSGGLEGPTIKIDISGTDPLTGEPFGNIAARSRAQHKTQGLAGFINRARVGTNEQTFMLLAGEPAADDLMDGVDATWNRVPGGAAVDAKIGEIISNFDPDAPTASLPALLELRSTLANVPTDAVIADKRADLDRIISTVLGLRIRSIAAKPNVAPGESVSISAEIESAFPVNLVGVSAFDPVFRQSSPVAIRPGEPGRREFRAQVPADFPLTHPYWLRANGEAGISKVDDPALIGLPENPPALPVEYRFDVGGQVLAIADEVVFAGDDATRRRINVVPPVSLSLNSDVFVLTPGTSKEVTVEIAANRAGAAGSIRLDPPQGWTVLPATRTFNIPSEGATVKVTFAVTAPASASNGWLHAVADIGGTSYSNRRVELNYSHLPPQLLQPAARSRAVSADISTKGSRIGYLPGAGDSTVEALQQLGYEVRILTGADLEPGKLAGLDAVVLGVRASNERADLAEALPGLFAWVESGGTVIAQYNRPGGLKASTLGPYELSIEGPAPALRVTDETAPVTFLLPDHSVLAAPNRITASDFEGWIQERGAYYPSKWDEERYVSILAMNDPGEHPLRSSLLVARHGEGHFIYTGLAFFRQLPGGVPGAYRLFANLVSLGK